MNIFINNKSVGIDGGKIKKMLGAAALIICCIMPLTISASAANNEIKLETNGSEASLELYFPQAAAEEIASMQVSVYVAANSDSVDLEFISDSGLASKIVESRYQSDTGTLNIYLAGTEALFSSYGFTKVGRIKISTSGSSAASAEVEVVKDSIRFVRSGELVSPDGDTDYPAAVNITAAGQSQSGTAEPSYPSYPSYPNYPAGNYFPNISLSTDVENNRNNRNDNEPVRNGNDNRYDVDDDDDNYDDFILEEQDTAGENFNPPDTSSLLDALSRADDYKEKDYSESSYDALKDAVNKAEKLISDPNATQEDIDEALLNIENAIGMLKYKNDIPSGAEGYSGNNNAGMNVGINNNGIFGENIDYDSGDNGYGQGSQFYDRNNTNHGGNGGGVQAAQDGDIVNASNGAQSVDSDPFSGKENRGKNLVLWIIVIAAIVVIASVTAIIFLKKANAKKSDAGNRFKN